MLKGFLHFHVLAFIGTFKYRQTYKSYLNKTKYIAEIHR